MKKIISFIAGALFLTTLNARCVYCILLDNGQQHCYISPNHCRPNLPPYVTCEELDPIAIPYYEWNSFLRSTIHDNVILKSFNGIDLLLLEINTEVAGHPNWVYAVTYNAGSDKAEVAIQYYDNSDNPLDAINNPDETIIKVFENIGQLRANGSTTVTPNPFTGSTSVGFSYNNLPENAALTFQVYTIEGIAVYTKTGISNRSVIQLTGRDLQAGTYIYKTFYADYVIGQGTIIQNN